MHIGSADFFVARSSFLRMQFKAVGQAVSLNCFKRCDRYVPRRNFGQSDGSAS